MQQPLIDPIDSVKIQEATGATALVDETLDEELIRIVTKNQKSRKIQMSKTSIKKAIQAQLAVFECPDFWERERGKAGKRFRYYSYSNPSGSSGARGCICESTGLN